jgi:Fe-S cluster assembly iron-binding protein IscA
LALDEPKENDTTLSMNDIAVVVESSLEPFLEDQVVDFVSTPHGQGLVISRSGMQAC